MDYYDSIVIGGGIAGMCASGLLASKGHKVILIERSNQLGGLVQTVSYNGAVFPVGAHHLSGSAKDGLVTNILESLGIATENVLIPIKQMDVQIEDKNYTIPLTANGLYSFIREEFPNEKKCEDFILTIRRYCTYYASNREEELLRFFKETVGLSYGEFMDRYFDNARLKFLLNFLGPTYGGLRYYDSAFSHLSLLVSYLCGTCYVRSGVEELKRQLNDCLKRLDVDILFQTEYKSVLLDGDKVVGVKCCNRITNELHEFMSDNVILTIDPTITISRQFSSHRVFNKIQQLQPGPTPVRIVGVASHILKGVKSSDVACIGQRQDVLLDEECKTLPMFMLCYPELAESYRVEGKTTFMLTFLTKTGIDLSVEIIKQRVLLLLEKYKPDLYATIESCNVIPSSVYKQLSGNSTGAAFGWIRDEKTTMRTNSFSPCVSGVPNLYVCGNWSTDFGLYGAIRSSERVVKKIQNKNSQCSSKQYTTNY